MSTRRARIKAVTALPPRRKNADADKKKQEPDVKTPKRRVSFEKSVPSTGKTLLSPARNLPSPRKSPRSTTRTPDRTSGRKTPVEKGRNTPIDTNQKIDGFLSPQARASPLRKPSPVVRTPVTDIDVGVERLITSRGLQDVVHVEKRTETVIHKINDAPNTPASVNKESGNITDDENPPSVSTDTEDVFDGIVPLQSANKTPKPIDLLKNEIISENAEVLFDPIVPLPSPSKVRPKLRPVPRLYPMRRNSIQGSASESEDESRRALHATPVASRQRHDSHTVQHTIPNRDVNRIRNDSICSSVSQSTSQAPVIGSPLREKNHGSNKFRRQEVSRRMAALHRRKESVKRDTLTMYDLIFYNPTSNPIIPDQDELKAKEASKKDEAERAKNDADNEDSNDKSDAPPVPQIKIGANGEIVLDEQSLVINRSGGRVVSSTVREGAWGGVRGGWRRAARTAEWADAETVRFYRALAALGTDFMLMQKLFPGRTRRDLKLKFKKEEKINSAQIDKALRSLVTWDVTRLENEFKEERKLAEENAKREKERLKKEKQAEKERNQSIKDMKIRQSKGSKALETSVLPSKYAKIGTTADDIIQHEHYRRKRYAKNEDNFNDQTPLSVLKNMQSTEVTQKLPILPTSSNVEEGSLVVLSVNDPQSPSKTMLQTYIARGAGELTPVSLPSTLLNSVVGHIKKGNNNSPLTSPSNDSRTSTPVNASPNKRSRLNSYTVTQL